MELPQPSRPITTFQRMSSTAKFQIINTGIADLVIGEHYYVGGNYLGKLISQQYSGYYKNRTEYSSYTSRLVLTFLKDGEQKEIMHTNGWDYNHVTPISM